MQRLPWLGLFGLLCTVAVLLLRRPDGPPRRLSNGPRRRLAFMFLTRGPMQHEAMWDAFFAGKSESAVHSIYVHPARGFKGYAPESIFHGA